MTDSATTKKTTAGPACGTNEVYCRRIKLALPIAEHKSCSYCFGKESDIETGDHAKFCDFEEGKDPISFGFPET